MELNLREIIENPGAVMKFQTALSEDRIKNHSIISFLEAPTAVGEIKNSAGALKLDASMRATMLCSCDRCGISYEKEQQLDVSFPLVIKSETQADDSEAFVISGEVLDVSDVLETAFILESESKYLCREDCKGVCPGCGEDLNEGSCKCQKQRDPRLAVLEQLLDTQEQ
ncbi:MAG: DUF177 domain-containing protein [Ruminococcaceae bacterium]|nr:DUF177 domain-containing protein [Oscillospiraceae bacterium]